MNLAGERGSSTCLQNDFLSAVTEDFSMGKMCASESPFHREGDRHRGRWQSWRQSWRHLTPRMERGLQGLCAAPLKVVVLMGSVWGKSDVLSVWGKSDVLGSAQALGLRLPCRPYPLRGSGWLTQQSEPNEELAFSPRLTSRVPPSSGLYQNCGKPRAFCSLFGIKHTTLSSPARKCPSTCSLSLSVA